MKPTYIALAASVLLVTTACGEGDERTPAGTAPYAALVRGLCEARASADDPDQARRAFFDNAHQPIHELAAAAAAGDPARLGVDIDLLIEATRGALAAVGQPPPRPCQEAP